MISVLHSFNYLGDDGADPLQVQPDRDWNGSGYPQGPHTIVLQADVDEGGTGRLTLTANGVLYGNDASPVGMTSAGINNTFLAGVTGAAPAFRALLAADIPNLDAGKVTTGTFSVARGGTGAAAFTANGVLYGNTVSAFGVTAEGATGTVMVGNTGAPPSFSASPTVTSLAINGTVPPTGQELYVVSTSALDPRGILSAQYSTDALGAHIHFRKARGTESAPATVVTADAMMRMRASGYDGANYIVSGMISVLSTGTVAATRVPSQMTLSTATDTAPSVLTVALTLGSDQSALFANRVTLPNNVGWLGWKNTSGTVLNNIIVDAGNDLYIQYPSGHSLFIRDTAGVQRVQVSSTGNVLIPGNVAISATSTAATLTVGGTQSGNAGFEIISGGSVVTAAYNRVTSAYVSMTFDGSSITFRNAARSGNFYNFTAVTATALNGATVGLNLDLNTSYTPGSSSITGQLITLPAITVANTNTYLGLSIVQSALTNSNGATTWTGLDVNMPAITQTSGTLTSVGLKITGGTVTSGTAYSIITSTTAGNAGFGVAAPTAVLHLKAGTATAGSAPLKFNAGVVLTTPEIGAMEFVDDGTTGHLYITVHQATVTTRVQIV